LRSLGTFGSLGFVFMYLVADIALIAEWVRERRRGHAHHVVTWVIIPVVGALVLGIPFWGDFQPGQAAPYSDLPWLFAALVGVGVLYTLFVQATKPDLLARTGAITMGEDAGTPDDEPEIRPARR